MTGRLLVLILMLACGNTPKAYAMPIQAESDEIKLRRAVRDFRMYSHGAAADLEGTFARQYIRLMPNQLNEIRLVTTRFQRLAQEIKNRDAPSPEQKYQDLLELRTEQNQNLVALLTPEQSARLRNHNTWNRIIHNGLAYSLHSGKLADDLELSKAERNMVRAATHSIANTYHRTAAKAQNDFINAALDSLPNNKCDDIRNLLKPIIIHAGTLWPINRSMLGKPSWEVATRSKLRSQMNQELQSEGWADEIENHWDVGRNVRDPELNSFQVLDLFHRTVMLFSPDRDAEFFDLQKSQQIEILKLQKLADHESRLIKGSDRSKEEKLNKLNELKDEYQAAFEELFQPKQLKRIKPYELSIDLLGQGFAFALVNGSIAHHFELSIDERTAAYNAVRKAAEVYSATIVSAQKEAIARLRAELPPEKQTSFDRLLDPHYLENGNFWPIDMSMLKSEQHASPGNLYMFGDRISTIINQRESTK